MKKNRAVLILIAVTTLLNVIHALAAVTLVSFTATPGDGQVPLQWKTAIKTDNSGFSLWCSTSETGGYDEFNDWLTPSDDRGFLIGVNDPYPVLPTATSSPATSYPSLPTATSISTTPSPLPPTATSLPEPTSTPTLAPAMTPTQTPMEMSLPTNTPATEEISSPTSTATVTKLATVTLSPTPPLGERGTPSPTEPPTLTPPAAEATPQPLTATATPTGLSLPQNTPTPTTSSLSQSTPALAATPVALPISRDPEGLGHLWLIGILLVALGTGLAWLAYSLIRKGR